MNKLKLSLDLVPASSWMNNVRTVLTSSQWDIIRKSVYDMAYNVCQICGGEGPKHPVECHEIWSYDEETQIQILNGMIALCPDCHMVKHFGLAQVKGNGELALRHFMKINSLKLQDAELYIKESFQNWDRRSKKKWSLDLSILSQYGIDVSKLKVKK